jgi:hypothetical protein
MYESSSSSPGVQFALGMDQLAQALDVLADVDLTEVDSHCLGERTLELFSSSRRLTAIQSQVADRFASTGTWVGAGAKSARAWIASQTNESAGRIGAVITTGRGMRSHEEMAQAFVNGEVSARHMDLLSAAGEKYPKMQEMLHDHAEAIIEIARYSTPARFAQELEALCHTFDPGAVEEEDRKRDAEAYVHLSQIREGMWRLDGLLPAEVGTQFAAVLDAARRRLRAEAKQAQETGEPLGGDSGGEEPDANKGSADTTGVDRTGADKAGGERGNEEHGYEEHGDGQHGDGETSRVDGRSGQRACDIEQEVVGIDVLGQPIYTDETPVQAQDRRLGSRQNVDALRLVLNLVASAKNTDGTIALPSVNGARPVVHLNVDIESLLCETENKAAAWLERFGVPSSVISATKAGLLACDATLEPMIIKDGRLVATLPSVQTVPAHLRKAVFMRDEQCRINSCTSAIDEVHHLIFLSQGGPTTMENLAGLCWFHHHLIHHGQWTLTGDANHELLLTNTTTGEQWRNEPPRTPGHRKRKRE